VRGTLVIPVLLVLALVHAALDEETGIQRWLHLRGELAEARARIELLRGEIVELRREAQRLEEDDFATERAIREELEYARPGQTLLRLRGSSVSNHRIP
jgi:cell division protein FtsB